jgi:transcriptional regulator with GAF, ATPase, and Fis domain
MSQLIIDSFFASIFILLFIFLIRIRDRVFVNNQESMKYTISGLFILFLTSMLRLFEHQGMFSSLPFLSESLYSDLAEAIGIITGIALMIAGVSIWLPHKKKREQQNGETVRLNEVVRRIEQEIILDCDINRLFKIVPKMLCECFGFSRAAVLRIAHKRREIICTDLFNPTLEMSGSLRSARYDVTRFNRIIAESEIKYSSNYQMQIYIDNNPKAAILFWKDNDNVIGTEENLMLERIARIFSYRLKSSYNIVRADFFEECSQYLTKTSHIVADQKDLRSNLQNIHLLLDQAVGSKYLSLAVLDRYRKNMRRFTIGRDRSMLLENGCTPPVENSQIERVLEDRRTLRIDDIRINNEIQIDSLIKSCGQKSLLSIPIISGGRVISVLTLGHPAANHFDMRKQILAETIASGMVAAIESEMARRDANERDRYMGALASFNMTMQKSSSISELFEAAAELLLDNIRTTMVRLTALERTDNTLRTRAVKTIRPFDNINIERQPVSRQTMRWHQMVIEENRPLLINQNDPESSMDSMESRALLFDKMQSALIVPIIINGLTYGLITLGEMRDWERFSYQPPAIVFCREIAAKLSTAIKLMMFSKEILKQDKKQLNPESVLADANMMQVMKSQVSTIRGSLDLLKLKGPDPNEQTDRIIATMEKSTNRMISAINEERETVSVR